VLFRNERAKHHRRVHSKKSESFATELQTKKTKKKHHLSFAYREQRHRVSSVDRFFAGREEVTFEVRETDFTERCRFKLSVLATDAFALMWMDWTIEAIIIIRIYFCVLL